MPCREQRGFTLVEVMVVIAIIAALSAGTLAVIATSRAAARRNQCSSNQRQLFSALVVYAQENQGGAPLVYQSCRQANYLVYDNANTVGCWGVVWNAGLIEFAQLLYCQAITTASASNRYNISGNLWPHQAGQYTRAGYALRPDQAPGGGYAIPAKVPQLGNYTAKAVLADLCSQSGHLDFCHITGTNVTYGDGHVRWCPRPSMAATWLAIPSNASWSNGYDAAETALWNSYDALP